MLGNLAGLGAWERVCLSSAVIGIHHCWEAKGGSAGEGSTGSPALGQALCCMGSGTWEGVYGHVQCVQTCMGMHSACTRLHEHVQHVYIPAQVCTVRTHTYRHILFLGQPWLHHPLAHPLPMCGSLQG